MKKSCILFLFLITSAFVVAQSGIGLPDQSKHVLTLPVQLKPTVVLYPNPIKHKVVLQLKGFTAGMVQIIITNDKGKIVKAEKRMLINGEEDVVMFLSLQPGIYSVKISEQEKEVRKRLVVLQ